MKYAAITEKLADFDISKGSEYTESLVYFKDELEAMKYQLENPTTLLIRFETVSLHLASENDLA